MNEFMQMKNQMQQLMAQMKQKDELISQQNIKLSQMGTPAVAGFPQTNLPSTGVPPPANPMQPPQATAQAPGMGQTNMAMNQGFLGASPQNSLAGNNQMNQQMAQQMMNGGFGQFGAPGNFMGFPQQFMPNPNLR
jgi:hypothetical protein